MSSEYRDGGRGAGAADDGVAIIGMSCLFPGAADLDAYWRNILGGVDAITDPPPEAWDPALHYDPTSNATDRVYCKRGGYLGALASFDPLAHGIPPVAVGGEPDQWLALRVARDAMEDAGCTHLDERVRQRTAVILGKGTYLNGGSSVPVQHGLIVTQTLAILRSLHPEYTDAELEAIREALKANLPGMGPEIVPGLIPNIIVGRIANRLDLMGPTYTVDAACASSLVAAQLALRHLRDGECDLALVGGAQVWMPVPTLGIFCQLGALSRRQQIRPFDKDADGTLLGEGIGMLVLKRLADAERDDDRIYAVIRGVGLASDGRGLSVMAPRLEGEEMALRRAYEAAGVSPATVGLIEAHGTGTPVGDITEIHALSRVFGPRAGRLPGCAVGSVKSMISHTIPAAGAAALIKVALALHHKVLPPTLNCDEPNPKLGLDRSPFYINSRLRPWIHGGEEPRRAGINSFGFGGINSHVVLEEYRPAATRPRRTDRPAPDHCVPWDVEVCLFEGETRAHLAEEARRWIGLVEALEARPRAGGPAPHDLADVAFTLSRRRAERGGPPPCCLAVVASSLADLRGKLSRAADRLEAPACRQIRDVSGIYYADEPLGRAGQMAFILPGEGAQYPDMLADLCLHLPEVRDCYDRFDRLFRRLGREYLPSDYIFPRATAPAEERAWADALLWRIEGAIESVRVANLALLGVLERLAIRPDLVVGHSSGEYAALQATGIIDLASDDELARVTRELVEVHEQAFGEGIAPAALLALGTGREQAEAIARASGVPAYVAMDNCPHQVVLVCDARDAGRVLELVRREGIIHETLPFDRPYHTPLFASYAEKLRRWVDRLDIRPARVPLYSCTTGDLMPDDPAGIRTLLVEHWMRPVEFRRTIEGLHDRGVRLFVESGPRGNLTSFVEDILRGRRFCAVAANVQRRSGLAQLNHLAGILAAQGVGVDTSYFFKHRTPRLIDPEAVASGSAPAARPALELKLITGFPPMTLPEGFARRLRPEPTSAAPPAALPETPREALPLEAAMAHAAPPAEVRVHAATAVPGASPTAGVGESDSGPAAPAEPVAPLMADFLQTMGQFLGVQERVMADCLAPAESDAAAAPAGAEGAGYPLLGEVVAHTPGEELVARRTFDPAEDLYLQDHALGRVLSDDDPGLRGLILMPLTMSLEVLAEAAAALAPGRAVVGLRDVRAHRWIAFGGGPQLLEVAARRRRDDPDAVDVTLRNLTEEAGAEGPAPGPVAQATVRLGGRYPDAPATPPAPVGDGPSRLAAERLYTDVMFHGPLWRGVVEVGRTGPAGSTATLRVLPTAGYLRRDPAPRFVLDPATLDAAGQVVGFWTMEHLDRGQIVFPCRLDALELYGPPRPAGEAVSCSASIALLDGRQVRSDLEIAGADGRPWMRLEGWYDRRFDLPEGFHPLILPSTRAELSQAWGGPGALLDADGATFAWRRMAAAPPSDRGFWGQVWAHRVLGRAERERFRRLALPEGRRLGWLAGRTAAKEAVRRVLLRGAGLEVRPADIDIRPGEGGRLVADGAWRSELARPPVVSIAHAAGTAFAVAALADDAEDELRGLGVDVEAEGARPRGLDRLHFGAEAMATLEAEATHAWRLRSWCAAQAAAKAMGLDPAEGPDRLSIASADPATGEVRVVPLGADGEPAGPALGVSTGIFDGWIVAAVVGRPAVLAGAGPAPARPLLATTHEGLRTWERHR